MQPMSSAFEPIKTAKPKRSILLPKSNSYKSGHPFAPGNNSSIITSSGEGELTARSSGDYLSTNASSGSVELPVFV